MTTEAAAAVVRESNAARTPLRISGRANWLTAGRPVKAHQTLSLREDTGVVSYVPGDLTLTVRAGTTLSEIERVTGEHDQWLPLDPFGSNDGTIGATIATASAGPLASSFGLPRDLLLGLEFVNGRGDIVRAGGRVVKNVAGFDLSRLLTGSWGTLGVITEVTLRLYARPKVDRSFVVSLKGPGQRANSMARAVQASLTPFALQFLGSSAAHTLGFGHHPVCLIRFGGNDAIVTAQLSMLSQISQSEEIESRTWAALRELDGDADSVVRISSLPDRFLETAAEILDDDPPGVYTSIDLRRGVLRIVAGVNLTHGEQSDVIVSVDPSVEGGPTEVIYEKLPAEVWPHVSRTVVADRMSQGIKNAYDPNNILNPGILGD